MNKAIKVTAAVTIETRGVLAGAYRGKDVSERSLLTHYLKVTDGGEWAAKSLCGRILGERLSDVDEREDATCEACAVKLAKLGSAARRAS
jgi:hypothetical protein